MGCSGCPEDNLNASLHRFLAQDIRSRAWGCRIDDYSLGGPAGCRIPVLGALPGDSCEAGNGASNLIRSTPRPEGGTVVPAGAEWRSRPTVEPDGPRFEALPCPRGETWPGLSRPGPRQPATVAKATRIVIHARDSRMCRTPQPRHVSVSHSCHRKLASSRARMDRQDRRALQTHTVLSSDGERCLEKACFDGGSGGARSGLRASRWRRRLPSGRSLPGGRVRA